MSKAQVLHLAPSALSSHDSQRIIEEVVASWRQGDVVAIPTETVYGLGADASNPTAVAKIFEAKGRPSDHPLIVHVAPNAALEDWASDIPEMARTLIDHFWPGPLTLILKRSAKVPDAVTGGQDTVGIRCPSHPVAQALLTAFGGGIAAPSANLFGKISPTSASDVLEELGDRIPLIVDGGDCEKGIESTIVDVSRGYPVLLRPGMISADTVGRVLGQPLARPDQAAPRVSGSLEQHYCPSTRLELVVAAALLDTAQAWRAMQQSVVIVTWSLAGQAREWVAKSEGNMHVIALPNHVEGVAHGLYHALREADHLGVQHILFECPPGNVEWEGVLDRLRRAAAGHQAAG